MTEADNLENVSRGNISDDELRTLCESILEEEANAILSAASRSGRDIVRAARIISSCDGRVVVSGLGKSGHVGRKIAATFASLGVPAFFLHAAEAAHGDLGMVCKNDVGLLMSNSGETEEVLSLMPYFRRIGASVIAMTGKPRSTLAQNSDVAIDAGVEREADPLGLAPTASTSVQMAVGDAIAGVCVKLRGIAPEDFAVFHPGGALGRRLLLRVCDLMGAGDAVPRTSAGASVREALFEITSKGYGATVIVGEDGELLGIFTDGDLRRLMEREGAASMELPVETVMSRGCRTILPEKLAVEAMRIMEGAEISVLVAVDGKKPVGIIHLHEILKAGLS
jgi:arabinose-5-phosphate isomerase